MAEKKPELPKGEQFKLAVYELGLTLIEDYRAGKCRDRDKTVDQIIELFKVSQTEGKSNGI